MISEESSIMLDAFFLILSGSPAMLLVYILDLGHTATVST